MEKISVHTCNFGVWAEIKWTIVVSRRVGTVGRNVLPDLAGEVEVVHHVLRDGTVVQFEGGGVEALIVVRNSKTLDVRWPNSGIVEAAVSHIARGRGDGVCNHFSVGASDYKSNGKRNADSANVWADLRHKNG